MRVVIDPQNVRIFEIVDDAVEGVSSGSADIQYVLDFLPAVVALADQSVGGSAWEGRYLVKNSEKT